MKDIEALFARLKGTVSEGDLRLIQDVFSSYSSLTEIIGEDKITIHKLRRLLFGKSSERRLRKGSSGKESKDESKDEDGQNPVRGPPLDEQQESAESDENRSESTPDPKRPGHGRNGADAYERSDRIHIEHPILKHKDLCPQCTGGILYRISEPSVIVRIVGTPPLQARIYERERLRCGLCGEVFSAPLPKEAGSQKYTSSAAAMLALLKYGSGVPWNRLESLQEGCRTPLPASTQWDVLHDFAQGLEPLDKELVEFAAQGELFHNDDTGMRILFLSSNKKHELEDNEVGNPEPKPGAVKVHTSAIVSIHQDRQVVLYFTGTKHAGENLRGVLDRRRPGSKAPLQMCDALSCNLPKPIETVISNCLAHARRNFVYIEDYFPEECLHVINVFAQVYRVEGEARDSGMSEAERLALHRRISRPEMIELRRWMCRLFQEKQVEPNSALGKAIRYMTKRWFAITRFYRIAGAPVDNNLCERVLKCAILHRKNAYFYKTPQGARVGDLFMGLIHTARLCKVEPFAYLTALRENLDSVRKNPDQWLPWRYEATVTTMASLN